MISGRIVGNSYLTGLWKGSPSPGNHKEFDPKERRYLVEHDYLSMQRVLATSVAQQRYSLLLPTPKA
jgi:hypothetical protein